MNLSVETLDEIADLLTNFQRDKETSCILIWLWENEGGLTNSQDKIF